MKLPLQHDFTEKVVVITGAGYIREVVQKLRTAGMHRIVTLSVTDKKILGQAFMKFES